MRKLLLGLVGATTLITASAASATITFNIVGASGTFGDTSASANLQCVGTPPCSFTDSGTFTIPVGYQLVSATITTAAISAATDLNFSHALGGVNLNGVDFTLSPNGLFEFGGVGPLSLLPINTIFVSGTTGGRASFSGTLAFAAVPGVPEPSTWMMMLAAFGAVGLMLRRRRRELVTQIA